MYYNTDVVHIVRQSYKRSVFRSWLQRSIQQISMSDPRLTIHCCIQRVDKTQGARPRLRGRNKHQAEKAIWRCDASSACCLCRTQCCRPYVCRTVGWSPHCGLDTKHTGFLFCLMSPHQRENEAPVLAIHLQWLDPKALGTKAICILLPSLVEIYGKEINVLFIYIQYTICPFLHDELWNSTFPISSSVSHTQSISINLFNSTTSVFLYSW